VISFDVQLAIIEECLIFNLENIGYAYYMPARLFSMVM
jgi:hypothetical protein